MLVLSTILMVPPTTSFLLEKLLLNEDDNSLMSSTISPAENIQKDIDIEIFEQQYHHQETKQ